MTTAFTEFARPWKYKLDVSDIWDDDDMPLRDKTAEIVRRIKASRFYKDDPDFDTDEYELWEIIDELADLGKYDDANKTDDELYDYFNNIWAAFYDWADCDKRVWVNIWSNK